MDQEKSRDEAIKFVTETVHGSDVRFVRLWFTDILGNLKGCLLYTSPSPRDATLSRMPSSA